jgi:sterol 3beta-glucosyltransferase
VRILIVGVGSRGDVAPYVGLGQRLQGYGHQVAIATHEGFAGMVRGAGLEWRRISGETAGLIRSRMQAGSEADTQRSLRDFVAGIGDDIVDAAEAGTDFILTCQGQVPLCSLVSAAFGVPSMGVHLAPSVPTADFPLAGATPLSGNGAQDNRAAGQLLLNRARSIYAHVLPHLGRRLGVPQTDWDRVWDDQVGSSGWPICHGYSPRVVPRPRDWPDNVEVVGYWWSSVPSTWRPDAQLLEFLDAGPPPIFVGFGSLAVGSGEQLGHLIEAATREAGVRAVVQSGWAEVSVAGADVLQIGDTPHEWLFPRMAAAVHHAGAGTTGAALRAALPTVAVPVMADQPFWAERIHQLDLGPAPIPFAELTPQRLAAAMRAAVDYPRHRQRAKELARDLSAEDGAGAVADRIEQLTARR